MQLDVKEIADKADMIINGYAITKPQAIMEERNGIKLERYSK